jgi:hypothetical protein
MTAALNVMNIDRNELIELADLRRTCVFGPDDVSFPP